MRSRRAVREGSTGLLIIAGVGLVAALGLWIRGITPGSRSYPVILEFENAQGIIIGTPVRYRGVPVGRVVKLQQGARDVEVKIEISSGDVVIPANAKISANQSGLVSSAYIDITPTKELSEQAYAMNPNASDCNSQVIVCRGDRLKGVSGNSIDQLIRVASRLAQRLDDEELFQALKDLAKNSSSAAAGVAKLTNELADLSKASKQELQSVSASIQQTTATLNRTLEQTSETVKGFGRTADQLTLTASQVSSLLEANRATLILTLDNLNQTTRQLRIATTELTPAISRLSRGELLANLEALAANTATASANLRNMTNTLSSPANLLMLQQTLESARSTFQNVEKITSDLDELTGDPKLRQNLRNLINGLSGLVSSTQQLEQQTQLAFTLSTLAAAPELPSSETQLRYQMTPTPVFIKLPPTATRSTSLPSPTGDAQ